MLKQVVVKGADRIELLKLVLAATQAAKAKEGKLLN